MRTVTWWKLAGRTPAARHAAGESVPLLSVAALALLPALAFPNPFCVIYNAINPWAFGAIMVGVMVAVIGFAMMIFSPHLSARMTGGLVFLGVAMLLLGLVSTDGGLDSVAGAFGVPSGHWCPRT